MELSALYLQVWLVFRVVSLDMMARSGHRRPLSDVAQKIPSTSKLRRQPSATCRPGDSKPIFMTTHHLFVSLGCSALDLALPWMGGAGGGAPRPKDGSAEDVAFDASRRELARYERVRPCGEASGVRGRQPPGQHNAW